MALAASLTAKEWKSGLSDSEIIKVELIIKKCAFINYIDPQPGMMQSIVVVISFHRVDRAYMIQCFYMEAEKTVASDLEVR
ncbi:hypothetical protein D918_05760 [Trichuris suis]|nr:hypothetical protein D918_05760 [Trichuris suis]